LEKTKIKEKDKDCVFDRLDSLDRPWPFIFIGRGGLAPDGVEILTNLVLKYNSNSDYTAQNRSDRIDNRSDRSAQGADLPKVITVSSELQIGCYIYAF